MKTNTFLAIQIFGMMTLSIFSCSKDDYKFEYVDQPVSAPKLRHVADSIYTPFFTPGYYDLNDHVISWGYLKGDLYITAPSGIKLDSEFQNVMSWDKNLDLGSYPITLTAKNPEGSAEDKFVLVSNFGGVFIRTYNTYPASNDGMSIGQYFYFEPNGILGYDDPWDYGNSIVGTWTWASKNEIQGYYSKQGQGRYFRYYFKAILDYDKATGLPSLNGH